MKIFHNENLDNCELEVTNCSRESEDFDIGFPKVELRPESKRVKAEKRKSWSVDFLKRNIIKSLNRQRLQNC